MDDTSEVFSPRDIIVQADFFVQNSSRNFGTNKNGKRRVSLQDRMTILRHRRQGFLNEKLEDQVLEASEKVKESESKKKDQLEVIQEEDNESFCPIDLVSDSGHAEEDDEIINEEDDNFTFPVDIVGSSESEESLFVPPDEESPILSIEPIIEASSTFSDYGVELADIFDFLTPALVPIPPEELNPRYSRKESAADFIQIEIPDLHEEEGGLGLEEDINIVDDDEDEALQVVPEEVNSIEEQKVNSIEEQKVNIHPTNLKEKSKIKRFLCFSKFGKKRRVSESRDSAIKNNSQDDMNNFNSKEETRDSAASSEVDQGEFSRSSGTYYSDSEKTTRYHGEEASDSEETTYNE